MSGKSSKTVKQAITEPKDVAPSAVVTIDGTEYTLCFDMEAFIRAEDAFAAQGHELNLLAALPTLKTGNVRTLFVAALQRHHADLAFEEAMALWRFDTCFALANVIADLYVAAIKRPETAEAPNPTEASPGT